MSRGHSQLWEPGSANIAQVGLLEDKTERIKFTIRVRSNVKHVTEGERGQTRGASTSGYQGRVSIAVTDWTHPQFPERGRYWEWHDQRVPLSLSAGPDPTAPPCAPCSLPQGCCVRSHVILRLTNALPWEHRDDLQPHLLTRRYCT